MCYMVNTSNMCVRLCACARARAQLSRVAQRCGARAVRRVAPVIPCPMELFAVRSSCTPSSCV